MMPKKVRKPKRETKPYMKVLMQISGWPNIKAKDWKDAIADHFQIDRAEFDYSHK